MNLIIDIGNTFAKIAVFTDNDNIIEKKILKSENINKIIEEILKLKQKYNPTNAILSEVKKIKKKLTDFLKKEFKNLILFDTTTYLPVKIMYKTPETLGKDRIAGIVAANNIFPEQNVLVFDAGTALTTDFINNKKEYLGGSISPGLKMRFKALKHFTDKLPETQPDEKFNKIYGNTTENSVKAGVQNGITYEIEKYIETYKTKYPDLKVTFTGGDTFFFKNKIKEPVFTEPDLVLKGLNIILKHNAK